MASSNIGGKWWIQGRVGCRSCARLRRSIFHFNLGNLRPPRSSLFSPRVLPTPVVLPYLPYPSSFAASLATSRICVSSSFTPSCFPLFPCLAASLLASPHPVSPFLLFRLIRSLHLPSSLAFFLLLQAPMTLSSRRAKLSSHVRCPARL